MDMFYLGVVVLLALAMLVWFISVRSNEDVLAREYLALSREQVNTYRLRLRDLAFLQEHDELDDKEYQSSVNELKRQLLQDLKQQQLVGQANPKKYQNILYGAGLLFMVSGVQFYYMLGEHERLDDWLEVQSMLPALGDRALLNKGEPLSDKELQQFALGLRTKLFRKDGDAQAWRMLGEVTSAIRDMDSSFLAFERAYKLDPNKPIIVLSYVQSLLMKSDQQSMKLAARLLGKLLQSEPNNINGLLMAGYIAEQMGQQDKAMATWQIVARLLPANDARMGFVNGKLGKGSAPVTAPISDQGVEMAKVSVHITLDETVKGKVPVGGTLFIYAKAAQGRPMPAAVIKLSEFDFPMTIELSDANAMLQDYKLSTLDKIIVWSRLSKDGDIAISAGELQGQSQVFSLKDTTEIAVTINQVL
ncbi:MAG: c-type cytochrome biogenesis protein CcmI [Algicola sp.]|nr:c-type cytochrome biogenesis protein CcmI [Algicola sp.]